MQTFAFYFSFFKFVGQKKTKSAPFKHQSILQPGDCKYKKCPLIKTDI